MARKACTEDAGPDESKAGEARLRIDGRKPKQPVTWVPAVLDLLIQKGHVTSQELAQVVGKISGGDAVTRCRQIGLPIKATGLAPGGDRKKLYALDIAQVWFALEECIKQQNRYARIATAHDGCPRRVFSGAGAWILYARERAKCHDSKSSQHSEI